MRAPQLGCNPDPSRPDHAQHLRKNQIGQPEFSTETCFRGGNLGGLGHSLSFYKTCDVVKVLGTSMRTSAIVWKNVEMKQPFSATVWREGEWYVSQCLEVDIASQGDTEEEALANLKEALELHFEPPKATRPPKVLTIEVEVGAA